MKNTGKTGMTLLELLIGFFLISACSLIFIQTMQSFRTETTFYSEHFIANSLLEKVLEQCYQESELNPYGMQAIGLADAQGNPYSVSTFITDQQTPLFTFPPITQQNMPALYSILDDNFNLTLESEKHDGFYEISATFNWQTLQGRGQSTSNTRVLSDTGEKEVLTDYSLSESEVESRVVRDIFNAPSTTIGANMGTIGGQQLLMGMGSIYYACFDWFNSDEFIDRYRLARSMETFYSPASEDFAVCSELYFDLARDKLHLMLSLEPSIATITANLAFIDNIPLPEKYITEARIMRSGVFLENLRHIFMTCVLKVAQRYEEQLKYAKTQRIQRQMVARVFNLNRILFVNRDYSQDVSASEIQSRINSFITEMQQYFEEKDPTIYRMALQEQGLISQNQIKQNFFAPRLINELFSSIDDFVQTIEDL